MIERFLKLDRHETDIVLTTDVLGKSHTLVIDESTGYCSHATPNTNDKEAKINHAATLAAVKDGTLAADEPGDHDDGA